MAEQTTHRTPPEAAEQDFTAGVVEVELAQGLGLAEALTIGVGTMIGAGFYALLGKVAGEAGMFAPIAFLGSAVLALDGTSDIFAAKEVLRDHLCLCGDVQASLLSLGKPEEVQAYCRKLIDEVGGDGGFFLSSGCELPAAIKPENLRAMLHTGKTYELSR